MISFFLTSLVLAITPGPDILFVLMQSALYGARAGIATTLGLASGLLVHTTAVVLGVAAFFSHSEFAFFLLKVCGACYLVYLAWHAFRATALVTQFQEKQFPGYLALYRRGILMNVTNPKVSIFFLAFLPQFCNPSAGNLSLQLASLGGLFMLATLLVFSSVAFMSGKLAAHLAQSARAQIFLHRCAGVLFITLALFLLFSH